MYFRNFWIFVHTFILVSPTLSDSVEDYYVDDGRSLIKGGKEETSSLQQQGEAELCVPHPLGGVEWILAERHPDYGWRDQTHRAVIALAVNNWPKSTEEEVRQMELQLEVELTKALLKNSTSTLYPNDLALYIHALIATRRNPHNFYGIDLVSRLAKVVDEASFRVHPFLLLALCNAKSFTPHHWHLAETTLRNLQRTKNVEHLVLALLAYECAGTLEYEVQNQLISEVKRSLLGHQLLDGSFGNLYTTSLIVQALSHSNEDGWDEEDAQKYLHRASTEGEVNMVSAYLIQLALNAENARFLKDLHPDLFLGPSTLKQEDDHHFVQYSLKIGNHPDVYFSISIKVPPTSNVFEIMNLSKEHDSKFNFSYYLDQDERPNVFSISGIPNDAEENLYWRLCLQTDVDHNRHVYQMKTVRDSPISLVPRSHSHIIYWYMDKDCEEKM